MAEDKNDRSLDEGSLVGLVRSSMPPPSTEADDDGRLDLRALLESARSAPAATEDLSAPSPSAPPVSTPADMTPKAPRKNEAPALEATHAIPVAAEIATPARSQNYGGLWIGLGIGAVACTAMYFTLTSRPSDPVVASTGPLASAPSVASAARVETRRAEEPSAPAEQAIPEAAPVEATDLAEGDMAEGSVQAEPAREPTAEQETAVAASAIQEAAQRSVEAEAAPARETTRRADSARTGQAAEAAAAPQEAAVPERDDRTRAARAEPAPAETASAPQEAAPRASALDSVLDQALGGRPDRSGTRTTAAPAAAPSPTPAAAPAADLPNTPSETDVRRVLGRAMPQIRACAGDLVGMAVATIMVRSDGTVGSVALGGSPFGGTPQGACMEGVLRDTRFPAFRQTQFRVQYPISIRPAL